MKPQPFPAVADWLRAQDPHQTCTTAITQAEILSGLRRMPRGKRRVSLEAVLEHIFSTLFANRVLTLDSAAAYMYAEIYSLRLQNGRRISEMDAMIAAIAKVHGAAVVTRNVSDFEHCGIEVINPWKLGSR